jgi:hypothetical protein
MSTVTIARFEFNSTLLGLTVTYNVTKYYKVIAPKS